MADINGLFFTGRLSKDAQVKTLPSGKVVTELDVANNVGFGDYAKTNWLKVKIWGERGANAAPIFKKGCLVGGSGELTTEEYDTKDGTHRTNLIVTVNGLQLLSKPKSDTSEPMPEAPEEVEF